MVGLTEQSVNKLVELTAMYCDQIKIFCLHLPDKNGNMTNWKFNKNYECVIEKIISVDDSIKKKINFSLMTMNNVGAFHESLSKYKFITNEWNLNSRAGNVFQMKT